MQASRPTQRCSRDGVLCTARDCSKHEATAAECMSMANLDLWRFCRRRCQQRPGHSSGGRRRELRRPHQLQGLCAPRGAHSPRWQIGALPHASDTVSASPFTLPTGCLEARYLERSRTGI